MNKKLIQILEEPRNIAKLLDDDALAKIGMDVDIGYKVDDESRAEWKMRNTIAMNLAMQVWEQKNFPFEKASNVKYPLLSIAAIQFSSRAYPNIVQGTNVVKGRVVGKDEGNVKADAAQRIETHMNYQITEEMEEWEENTDKLLTVIPILGTVFKETYFSPVLGRNMSEYCSPDDIVINYKAKSMLTVPRITKKFYLYPNEIVEKVRAGLFLDIEYGQPHTSKKEDEDDGDSRDEFRPHLLLAQHTLLDLDNDGYKEPYIVTYHVDTQKVVRIVPRFRKSDIWFAAEDNSVRYIIPTHYFTKFGFMPSPDGSIYDIGFGSLLSPINFTVNTTVNQLLDAGTISNAQGGFLGKGINLGRGRGGGAIRLKLNEWMPVTHSGDDLRKNIVPLPSKEPSGVLFSLLGFMVNSGEKLSSVTELLMGEQSVQNEPATTSLARIEQGLKVFSAIYKRLFRSFKEEFGKLFVLNSQFTEEDTYYNVHDSVENVARSDYDTNNCNVVPVANPNEVSDTQKLMKAQILYGLKGQGFNDAEINKRFLESMQIPDVELILDAPEPAPDPKLVLESEKIDLDRSKLEFEMSKYPDERAKVYSEVVKNLAIAEAQEVGPQLEEYKANLQAWLTVNKEATSSNAGSTKN